jgi:predicted phosphohydrolase
MMMGSQCGEISRCMIPSVGGARRLRDRDETLFFCRNLDRLHLSSVELLTKSSDDFIFDFVHLFAHICEDFLFKSFQLFIVQ